MTEEELRDCFAMLRAITGASAIECYEFADEMLEVRKKDEGEELGIAAVKPRRRYNRKGA
jgi:hypothetical protein